jgi:hypothetical protein
MKLIKVKDGLLEAENYFLISNFNDFSGIANVTRDISTGKLKLISNNKIERNFSFPEFVLEIEKENFNLMGLKDNCIIYLGNNNYTFGMRERKVDEQHKFWKLLKQDNYIQSYVSDDGVSYINIDGMSFDEELLYQGFKKNSNEDFILDNYKLYSSPYVTIQNFPEGTVCELYDESDILLKTRTFNSDCECKIFLDSNINGYFIFKDSEENVVFQSELLNLNYGNVYILSPYELEIIYNGLIVNNTNSGVLKDLNESITIKNMDSIDYVGLNIGIQSDTDDLIQLSLDDITYTDTINFDLLQNTSKDIFVKITRSEENHNFYARDFQLIISE